MFGMESHRSTILCSPTLSSKDCWTPTMMSTYSAATLSFYHDLQASLHSFHHAWHNHPLRTEQNMTPNQLWEMGQCVHPVPGLDNDEGSAHFDWDDSGYVARRESIIIPTANIVLTEEQLEELKNSIDPLDESESFGMDIYINTRGVCAICIPNVMRTKSSQVTFIYIALYMLACLRSVNSGFGLV